MLEPTAAGLEAVGGERSPARAGGLVHRYWRSVLADAGRRDGYEVSEEELVGGGRAIDLVARREGEVVAIELEVSGRRLEESIEKLEAFGATRCILACADREMLDRAREALQARGSPGGIEAHHVWSFLSRDRSDSATSSSQASR